MKVTIYKICIYKGNICKNNYKSVIFCEMYTYENNNI